jgi:hypothetical protein
VTGPAVDPAVSGWLRSRARRLRWEVSTARRALRRPKRRIWPQDAIEARAAYGANLERIISEPLPAARELPLAVHSFSSIFHLPEQVASLRSFLSHAGVPRWWIVISDGSHSRRERELLRAVHPRVSVVDWRECSRPGLPRALWDYAAVDRMGKKLVALVSLPSDWRGVYTDADILYFSGAGRAPELSERSDSSRYIRDTELRRELASRGAPVERFALDAELLESEAEAEGEVNSGFLLLRGGLDWAPALRRLAGRRWKPTIFTEQTVVHLTLARAGAQPLDPSRFVLRSDDRGHPGDAYAGGEIVLRHYVTPVRHKLWQAVERYGSGG